MDLEAEISFHESSSMHADFPDTPQPEPQAKAPDASQTPVLEPQGAAGLAPQPQGAAGLAPTSSFEDWAKLDNMGLIAWIRTLGLLPKEVEDAVDVFESNPDMDGSALNMLVDGEEWMMEMQFPDDFGLLREKLVKAIEDLRAGGTFVLPQGEAPGSTAADVPGAGSRWLGVRGVLLGVRGVLRPRLSDAPPFHQRCDGGASALYEQQFSAVHALNNLFVNEAPRGSGALFGVEHLDAIAQRLQRDHQPHALINPHRWPRLGNFDAEVVSRAVALLGYRSDLWGAPHSTLDTDSADLPSVAGFIVSAPSHFAFSRTHRYCIREVGGRWYRLDSKKPEPVEYTSTRNVFGHLQHIADHGGSILRIRRAAPNIYAMGVDDVVELLRSLGLGEPLPYAKRCRDMHIDGFWLSMCGDDELREGRPMKKPEEPGHNEMQGLMVQFPPHRKLLRERIEALKAAAAGTGSKSDVRLQESCAMGSAELSEAKCVDTIRKAFPFFSVATAYDAALKFGGNGEDAVAALREDAALVRQMAADSVRPGHHAKHPVHGTRPLSRQMRRLRDIGVGCAVLVVLYYLGLLALAELCLLRLFAHSLGCVSYLALSAQTVMANAAGGARWIVASPFGAAVRDQFAASVALLLSESETALLMLYRHGPALTLPVLETEIGFWSLPANFEASAEQMSVLCDAITWQHSGFWSSHLVQCRELFADKEQGFVRTVRSAALFGAGGVALRKATALPQLALQQLQTLRRQVMDHERAMLGAMLVASCEFAPRIARELTSHVELHMTLCTAPASALSTVEGAPGGVGPDVWARAAWVVAACAWLSAMAKVVAWLAVPAVSSVVFGA